MSNESGRGEMLADLADAVRELTEPRHHTEFIEQTVMQEVPSGRRKKSKRTRRRVSHTVTLPGLLESLQDAMVPGVTGDADGSAGFESRPSADLEPVAVLREIQREVATWTKALGVKRSTLSAAISGLVGAQHTDSQLRNMLYDARRWVRRARLATGFDPSPIILGAACPYCGKRNALSIGGDLHTARCKGCGVDWTPDTIGLLADMLDANQAHDVLALPPCWMPDCRRYGEHDRHEDSTGHSWGDSCELSDPSGRISA